MASEQSLKTLSSLIDFTEDLNDTYPLSKLREDLSKRFPNDKTLIERLIMKVSSLATDFRLKSRIYRDFATGLE